MKFQTKIVRKQGKYYQDKTGSKNLRKINVYRWDPSTEENPRLDTYEVDMDNCPSKVLDILNKIKNEIDPTLAYRRSCAHGVCGSCAMNMGGKNGLACTTPLYLQMMAIQKKKLR